MRFEEAAGKRLLVRVIIKVQKIAKTSKNRHSIEYKFKFDILFSLLITTSLLIEKTKCCTVSQMFKSVWNKTVLLQRFVCQAKLVRSPKSRLLFLFLSSITKCAFSL